jgi:hypothetical protein
MTMRFVSVTLNVRTEASSARYYTEFGSGLNVIEAPNSWGKSTLVQSLVYGLGLEGSFSASHLSPLGEAMTTSIELDGYRQAVVESSVTLVVANDRGELLKTQRWATSLSHDRHLVRTWTARDLAELNDADPVDLYVREAGAAVNELGFHRTLAEFIGWNLPSVPTFGGGERPLYLEVLFPMFYIEQKYGWSGLAPRIPTHYQIQSPYRRAAEFVLGLASLERFREIELRRQNLVEVNARAREQQAQLERVLIENGWRLRRPVQPRQSGSDVLNATSEDAALEVETAADEWLPVETYITALTAELATAREIKVASAGERTEQARLELRAAEREVRVLGARAARFQELLDESNAEHQSLTERSTELEADRARLIDIAKIQRLGSELSLPSLDAAHCPTCAQSLDAQHVVTGIVLDIAANTKLVTSELSTVASLLERASSRQRALLGRIQSEQGRLQDARQAVRTLRDELTSQTNAPSVSQVRSQLVLEGRISSTRRAFEQVSELTGDLSTTLAEAALAESHLRALRRADTESEDSEVVRQFQRELRVALGEFGFSSLPVEEVTISERTLLPEHEGFELTFDINHGLSASDTIRAKWAYYTALATVCASRSTARPLGTLIMDEPRQQEAARNSVSALYRELSEVGRHQQVIVASSADTVDLDFSLEGLEVTRIRATSGHVLVAGSA